ncbi:MAG TPA: hypothetical protein VKP60_09455, partial [Magnetospirillaceae bacterium]|nr:hypothetical protein [Magnetospirillaceae bacterium]
MTAQPMMLWFARGRLDWGGAAVSSPDERDEMGRKMGRLGRMMLGMLVGLSALSSRAEGTLQAWDRIVPVRFNRLTAGDGMASGMV